MLEIADRVAMVRGMIGDRERLVLAGYDDVADAYLERFGVSEVRQHWFQRLVGTLPPKGGRVLDLGCGAGIPVARDLTALGHTVVGVDGSRQQILRARRNVPQATFIEADMCTIAFKAESFDAVGAFYSITHVPPARQADLIVSISKWLKPGGTFVGSFGAGPPGEWTGEWLGTTMFFAQRREEETLESLVRAGLSVLRACVEKQDNEETAFMWVEAAKDRTYPEPTSRSAEV